MAQRKDIVTTGLGDRTAFQCEACGQNFAFVPHSKIGDFENKKAWYAYLESIVQEHLNACEGVKRYPYQKWAKVLGLDKAAVAEKVKGLKGTTGLLGDGSTHSRTAS